jgi:hypothetical protein
MTRPIVDPVICTGSAAEQAKATWNLGLIEVFLPSKQGRIDIRSDQAGQRAG